MKRLAVFVLALLPGACHYQFTAPFFWSHHSSAAFEAWAMGWVVGILLPIVALCLPLSAASEKP